MRPTPKGEEVILNVYDLMDNSYLYPMGFGAYHSGIVVFGREYTFSDGGIFDTRPKDVEVPFRTSITMGIYKGTYQDFQKVIDSLRSEFARGTYNLYTKNCNCFSNALSLKLTNKAIPGWVNRMAGYGESFQNYFGGNNNNTTAPIQQKPTSSTNETTQPTGHKLSESKEKLPDDPEQRRKMIAEKFKKHQQSN